jgi:short-subunit dehydrogenase
LTISVSEARPTAAIAEWRGSEPAVVITGASSGIGRAFALLARQEAASIVCIGRSQQALAALAEELRLDGGDPRSICLDLLDPNAGAQIERSLAEQNLYCDVLINSAGLGAFGSAAALSPDEHEGILAVNIRALTDLTLRFLPGMLSRGRGGVINVGSIAGYFAGPSMAAYYASKAYVRSFSDALWTETRGTGVTVTCVSAGPTQTAFRERSRSGRTRLFKILPRTTAQRVAEVGWQAFKSGRRCVVPGVTNRIIIAVATFLPRAATLRLIALLQRQA